MRGAQRIHPVVLQIPGSLLVLAAVLARISSRPADIKEWFVATPATAGLTDAHVKSAWDEGAPGLDAIIQQMGRKARTPEKSRFLTSTNHMTDSPSRKEVRRMSPELFDFW